MTSFPALLPLILLLPCAGGQTTGEDATFANVVGQGAGRRQECHNLYLLGSDGLYIQCLGDWIIFLLVLL